MSNREDERMECSECGSLARITEGNYLFKECGLSAVSLIGVELITCDVCGNADPVIPDVNDLMAALAWHISTQKFRLSGEHVRFLRKYLKMTATDFSKLIGVHKSTLSKWENDDDTIGETSDRLIRSVALTLGDGLKSRAEEGIRSFTWIVEEYHSGPMSVDMDTLEVLNT